MTVLEILFCKGEKIKTIIKKKLIKMATYKGKIAEDSNNI